MEELTGWEYCSLCGKICSEYILKECEYCENLFCPHCDRRVKLVVCCDRIEPTTVYSSYKDEIVNFCNRDCARYFTYGFQRMHDNHCRVNPSPSTPLETANNTTSR